MQGMIRSFKDFGKKICHHCLSEPTQKNAFAIVDVPAMGIKRSETHSSERESSFHKFSVQHGHVIREILA
jgi:hypothetical protein